MKHSDGIIKNRLTESLRKVNLANNVDENRFEQELIYYLEKMDMNEEKVRLVIIVPFSGNIGTGRIER
jgi:uncharacterized protein YicC (UPF0701 family)